MFMKPFSNNTVFSHFLKARREEAWHISMGTFHSVVATTEKAQFLEAVCQASLGVATHICETWLALIDNLRER